MMAAKGIELASAYVSLGISTDDIPRQVKKALSGVDRVGAEAGRDMGRRMASEVTDIMEWAGRESGDEFTSAFKAELNGEGRRAATGFTGTLEQQSDRSGRTSGRKFADSFERSAKPDVDIDTSVGRDAGSDTGSAFMGGFGGSIAGLGARGGPIAAAIVAGGLAGIKVLGPQISAAMDFEMSRDVVQARLGIDPDSMARIADASGKAFASNWGPSIEANMDTATSAIQSGLLQASSSPQEIQKTIEQLTSVSALLGEDIPAVSRSASQAIRTGMASDVTGALDLIVKGQQAGLNVSGDMLDSITEYGTQFRKLGLEGPEAMALISQAVKGGARDTDVAADALKEFSIRAVDNSETTRDAFTSMGFDADTMASKFAAGGNSARDAFGQVLDSIRSIQDPVEQARVGVALFGTQYEDLGAAANKFDLSKAVTEFGRVEGASQRAATTMSDNVGSEWQQAKNNLVAYANEVRQAWNMDEWFNTIPKAINEWLAPPPPLTPGGAGVPPAPTIPPGGPAFAGPMSGPNRPGLGNNPLDVFAPTASGSTASARPTVATVDQIASQFGLTKTSGLRPGDDGYHGSGQAGDYSGSVEKMQAFAAHMSRTYGPNLLELIFDAPGWSGNVKNGAGTGAFGNVYTMDQAGDHSDHVHVAVRGYDTGGWWPSGTLGMNATGGDELVLNPDQLHRLEQQGVDPNSLLHGQAQGAMPGPQGIPSGRTTGYIPAAAANTNPVGEGGISNFLDLGESFVHNLIDTGAQAASMAATAAAGASSAGAGAAAGPAASTAIQMGAEAAKRGVSWLYDLGGIWGEALVEQAMPFGAPHWLGSANPMAFMPQIPGQQPGDQRGQAGAAAQSIQRWAQPGNPAMDAGTAQQGAQAALAATPRSPNASTTPTQVPNPTDPSSWLTFGGIFDQGGVLEPKSFGINLSRKPEYVMTQRQLKDMEKHAYAGQQSAGKGDTNNFYATNIDETLRQWEWAKRRQSRRYSGRP